MTELKSTVELLQRAAMGQVSPQEFFSKLPNLLPEALVAVRVRPNPGEGALMTLSTDNGTRVGLVFTHPEAAGTFLQMQPEGIDTSSMSCVKNSLRFTLQAALREGTGGLAVDAGTVDLMLDRRQMQLLFREYALSELGRGDGAWVVANRGSILAMEMTANVYAIPLFLSEADAGPLAAKLNGAPQRATWAQILQRCRESGADQALLQYDLPEQVPLSRRQLATLGGAPLDPLDHLEDVLAGNDDPMAVCLALSKTDRIWVLADAEGAIVTLGDVLDLFTTAYHAYTLIQLAKEKNPQLGPMQPRLLPMPGLFRLLVERGPAPKGVAVNRGTNPAWYGPPNTLRAVLVLKAHG